jgi:hypothetical protein
MASLFDILRDHTAVPASWSRPNQLSAALKSNPIGRCPERDLTAVGAARTVALLLVLRRPRETYTDAAAILRNEFNPRVF